MKKKAELPDVSCVDLFCGAGGLTYGLKKGGIRVAVGVDIDEASRYPYEHNNPGSQFLESGVEELTGKDLAKYFDAGGYRLLAGCAPCQPFSTYSQGRRKRSENRWALLREFGRLVEEVQPDLITMENVPQLLSHPVFDEFVTSLRGYHVWSGLVECPQYGIPQRRKRLVLLASKLGEIELIPPTHKKVVSVREAIGNLPAIEAGEASARDRLHVASNLSEINLSRIRQSKPGGTWRDWDEHLVADCHRKSSGVTYPAVYGRMSWDEPAPTVTTQCFGYGNGRFGHPVQDRAISLREAAILQTFPKSYQFTAPNEPIRFNVVGRLIGNAVPVRLGTVIAMSIRRHIAKLNVSVQGRAKKTRIVRRKGSA